MSKMKTAQDWRKQWYDTELMTHEHAYAEMDKLVRAIQLDAMKEGMRRAAEIAEGETFAVGGIRTDLEVAYDQGCNDCEKAILTAAEQLTEADL